MKGFAILCVVIGHIPEIYIARNMVDAHAAKVLLNIMNVVYMFHMPLFMMISGYVYLVAYFDDRMKADKKRIYRQAGNMAIVYLLFNLAYVLLKVIFGKYFGAKVEVKDVLLIWAKPIYIPFWYLYVLTIYYLFFSLGRINANHQRKVLLILSIITATASFFHIDWFKISNLLYFAVFFYIGMLYRRNPGYIIGNRILTWMMFFFAMVLAIIFWDKNPFESFEKAIRIEQIPIVKAIVALGISLALWEVFENGKMLSSNLLFKRLGRHSLEIYLMHNILLSGLCLALMQIGIKNMVMNILLNLALSIAIPIFLSQVCKRLKIYDLFFKPLTFMQGKNIKQI